MSGASVVEAATVEAVVERLCREFAVFSAEQIRSHVVDIYADFVGAPVQAFVPVLVEKRVRRLLRTGGRPLAVAPQAMIG